VRCGAVDTRGTECSPGTVIRLREDESTVNRGQVMKEVGKRESQAITCSWADGSSPRSAVRKWNWDAPKRAYV